MVYDKASKAEKLNTSSDFDINNEMSPSMEYSQNHIFL